MKEATNLRQFKPLKPKERTANTRRKKSDSPREIGLHEREEARTPAIAVEVSLSSQFQLQGLQYQDLGLSIWDFWGIIVIGSSNYGLFVGFMD